MKDLISSKRTVFRYNIFHVLSKKTGRCTEKKLTLICNHFWDMLRIFQNNFKMQRRSILNKLIQTSTVDHPVYKMYLIVTKKNNICKKK